MISNSSPAIRTIDLSHNVIEDKGVCVCAWEYMMYQFSSAQLSSLIKFIDQVIDPQLVALCVCVYNPIKWASPSYPPYSYASSLND